MKSGMAVRACFWRLYHTLGQHVPANVSRREMTSVITEIEENQQEKDNSHNNSVTPQSSTTSCFENDRIIDKTGTNAVLSPTLQLLLPDNPCWGTPDACSLAHLLTLVSRSRLILYESPDYLILNKPPDLRMDGPYPASVYKLLTFWYPPPSLRQLDEDQLLNYVTHHVHQSKNVTDFELRPCHQLDYATSGVLLAARNAKAAAVAVKAFEQRSVKKVYLALVHGHVHAHHVLQKSANRFESGRGFGCVVSQTYLDEYMRRTEQVYQRSRQRQQRKPNSFLGSQPAPALFQKWKSLQRRRKQQDPEQHEQRQQQQEQPKLQAHEKVSKRPPTDPILSPDDWKEIWKATTNLLTEDDQKLLLSLEWKQVKANAPWKNTFIKASELHNNRLRASLAADATSTTNQTLASDNVNHCLPTLFRVEDDDNLNRFYIYAALAEVPNQFAVELSDESKVFLADSTDESSRVRASSSSLSSHFEKKLTAAAATTTASTATLSDSISLDYKPSLTQCTILDHAYLELDNGRLCPVTKVQLEPKTGRRHQLRIHMAHILGAPIVQDMTYTNTTATTMAKSFFEDPTFESNIAETTSTSPSPLAPLVADESSVGNSTHRSLRMCLHAHTLTIPLHGIVENGEATTPSLVTAVAPDPFVINQVDYGQSTQSPAKLLQIVNW